jgi:hypothetical protein
MHSLFVRQRPLYDQPKMATRYTRLRASAPYLLLVFVLIFSLQNVVISIESIPRRPGFDQITITEKRFSGLRSELPKSGVIGYLTGTGEFPANVIVDPSSTKSYFMAQYVLSPLVLINRAKPRFVIGDFKRKMNLADVRARYQLRVVKDLRSGVILFEKK